jgi:hypothetical protein
MLALLLVGCDQRSEASGSRAAETTAAVAAPDTVVRRVLRRTRTASAIQRVTPAIADARALEPLDSLLAVRIYDQRGVELRDVPVTWIALAPAPGAALRVVNARTDSLGISRAQFTPGTSADTQHVAAAVPNVGRIDFGVVVPTASVRIHVAEHDVWSGDEVGVSAELRDVAGRLLSGGHVQWASNDTGVARVRPAASAEGVITGVSAGNTRIVAWVGAGKVQDSARVNVRAVLRGRVVTLDGSAPPPVRIELRSEGVRQQLTVSDAAFSARIPFAYDAPPAVELVGSVASSGFHAFDVRVHAQRDLENLRIVLVPTTWRIPAGTYAGRDVVIDAAKAMQRTGRTPAFWRLVPLSGLAPRRLMGWAESDLPIHIGFNRARSVEPVSASDSAAFWSSARQMERDLGMQFFAPAEMRDTASVHVVPVEIGVQGSEGHTFIASGAAGNADDGVVLFRHSGTLHDAHVVTHELLHLIGFGHTDAWPTVSLPAGGTETRLTAHDVAYVQLAYRLRRFQRETGARPGLPIAAP